MIDMASVYAERYKQNPQALQAAVMGQSPDPKLDPYTALNALRLVKESNMMAMAGKAQQPTSSPSIVSEAMTPPTPPQGLGAMMPMGAPAARLPPQPQMAQAPQGPMQMASGGLAGMYTPEEHYVHGGIVAFEKGGTTSAEVAAENDYQGNTDTEGYSDSQGRDIDADGNLLGDTDSAPESVQGRANTAQQAYANFNPADMTPEEIKKVRQDYLDFLTANAGPDIYGEEIKRGAQDETDRGKRRNTGEAMALLTAAGKVLKGHNLAMGASEALPAYAQQMSEVDRADQAARDANRKMQFALKDAQRKERKGDLTGAQAAVESARKFQQDANKAKGDKLRYSADIATRNVQYARPLKGAGSSGPKVAERLADAEIAAAKDPKNKELQLNVEALRRTQKQINEKATFSLSDIPKGGPKDVNTIAPITSRENIEANKELAKHKIMNGREWRKSVEAAGSVEAAENQFKRKWITNNPQTTDDGEAPPTKPSAAPAAAPKPTNTSKTVTMADINATVTASGKTKQEVMDALKANGYIIK